jgi:LPS-assembly protein
MSGSGEKADRATERAPPVWAALAAVMVASAAPAIAFAQPGGAIAPTPAPDPAADKTVVLEADTLTQDETAGTITAEGDVQARYQGRTLRADRVVYDTNARTIHAIGKVEIVDAAGNTEYADEIQVDDDLTLGVATELRARFGPNGALAARSALRAGPGKSELRRVIYTSCPICEDGSKPPTWTLRARRAIEDQDSRVISYRGAVLEVTGVPVLYLPYFAHPDPSAGAHSGLLTPDFGANRRLGTHYEQPYLWAISPSSDLTVTTQLNETVNPLLAFDYRKRFWSGDLRIQTTVTQEQDFDSNGNRFGEDTTRSSVFASGRFRINDYWKWGFGAERVTDDLYLRRYDIVGAGETRGPYVGDYARLISQLYAIGQDDQSYASLSLVSFQGLRATDSADLLPLILPYAEYDKVWDTPVVGGQFRFTANTAALQRTTGPDSARVSAGVSWRKDMTFGPGWVASPFLYEREDYFRVTDPTTSKTDTFGRNLGYAGAELSWPFMRAGEAFDVIVEPVAMAAYGSDVAPDPRIVNEDSIGFEVDDSDVFRPDAAPNYDLWEPGGRVALGVRATARAVTGQSASLILGRRWRSEPAAGFTDANNLDGRSSDWVGAVNTDFGRSFGAQVRLRLDDQTLEVQRVDADVRAALWRINAHARYFNIDDSRTAGDPRQEISGDLGVDLVRGWRLAAGLRRDLDSGTNISQEIRAVYEDDCTFLEIAYTRTETFDRRLGPDEGIRVRIGLRSLGLSGGAGPRPATGAKHELESCLERRPRRRGAECAGRRSPARRARARPRPGARRRAGPGRASPAGGWHRR